MTRPTAVSLAPLRCDRCSAVYTVATPGRDCNVCAPLAYAHCFTPEQLAPLPADDDEPHPLGVGAATEWPAESTSTPIAGVQSPFYAGDRYFASASDATRERARIDDAVGARLDRLAAHYARQRGESAA